MTDIRGATPASEADLTERLRDAANRRGYYDSTGNWVSDGQLLDEAADEIERLRKVEQAIALLPPTLTVDGRPSVNVPQLLVAYVAIEAALKAPAPTSGCPDCNYTVAAHGEYHDRLHPDHKPVAREGAQE